MVSGVAIETVFVNEAIHAHSWQILAAIDGVSPLQTLPIALNNEHVRRNGFYVSYHLDYLVSCTVESVISNAMFSELICDTSPPVSFGCVLASL